MIGKTSQYQSQGPAAARDDFSVKGLTSSEATATTKDLAACSSRMELAAEIAKGRLALMAIISMLFQKGLGDREGPPGPNGDHQHAPPGWSWPQRSRRAAWP
jgi:hypothetical protein